MITPYTFLNQEGKLPDICIVGLSTDLKDNVEYFVKQGITRSFIYLPCISNTISNAEALRKFFKDIEAYLKVNGIKLACIAHTGLFKAITRKTKVEHYYGYIVPYSNDLNIMYLPLLNTVFNNPDMYIETLKFTNTKINEYFNNTYTEPGFNIIKNAVYPNTVANIKHELDSLLDKSILTCDIETFSLKHYSAGIASIAFSDSDHSGISFAVDLDSTNKLQIRELLKEFFTNFKGTLVFHNCMFDIYVLTYQLFMTNLDDKEGQYQGISILTKNFDDTMIMAYCCYNSCSGNELGLKTLTQTYSGDYAEDDIKDITKIPLDNLLKYNLTDTVSTFWLYNKLSIKIKEEDQYDIYVNLFKPSLVNLLHIQLNGLPIDIYRVYEVRTELENEINSCLDNINNNKWVKEYETILKQRWVNKKNETLKSKKVTLDNCTERFNIKSNKQLTDLLYNYMKLPILGYTKTKAPAIDAITLKKLANQAEEDVKEFINTILDYMAADKILTTFIKAFEENTVDNKLYGKQVLGGTVSGRLASRDPNLANLPSGSKYGKLIKSCFKAPNGWLFVGLDFNALEDRISALLTKDPEKLKIYTEGFDSHCYRAYKYFSKDMPEIHLADSNTKCFKVTYEDGTIEYLTEDKLNNV